MKLQELFEDEERSILSVMGEQPERISNYFCCEHKKITSLKGSPKWVSSNFYCHNNKLTSFEGGPEHVDGSFYAYLNKVTTLEGAPKYIGETFGCAANKLTSLHNIHKHIKYIGNGANFSKNPIKSHVLGLLLIDGLKQVEFDDNELRNIINKHLKGDRDVFACQEELIENGLEDFAQL